MKNVILAALVVGTGFAHAQAARQVGKGAVQGGRAAVQGGRAAVAAPATIGITQSIAAAVASVMSQNRPVEAQVNAFSGKISQIRGLDTQTQRTLVDAFRTGMVDEGCTDANLTAPATTNFAGLVKDPTAELLRSNETVGGLASMAKNSDLNKDGRVSAEETAKSQESEQKLINIARVVVNAYATQHGVSAQEAKAVVNDLARQCGLSKDIGIRAGL